MKSPISSDFSCNYNFIIQSRYIFRQFFLFTRTHTCAEIARREETKVASREILDLHFMSSSPCPFLFPLLFQKLGTLLLVVNGPPYQRQRMNFFESIFEQSLRDFVIWSRLDLCPMAHIGAKHGFQNRKNNRHDGRTGTCALAMCESRYRELGIFD